ncbi:metalloregulator ArsR/SmtB family transcription factor [Rhodobacter capsulatus]|uniref:metalloregulator ArsR/SmtB family transcription factor n=2 Tax=Rhodobacter capsulatus TaxID=1061 RepID=UPI0003D3995D|nr:metalloregulator ArsR/SmtB family transcription factor [Rhodobacter capsulatus]ETD76368.1 ArsR family transcriptional regulator [Rhodobacter capsulatus B6]ETD81911.1 ArsR family transcriptional regulator [Rhodobacter capsulatus YW1]
MENTCPTPAAAAAFACLGHPGRLSVFRMLMRFAPQGVRPTEIAAALGLKPNTLSHHLADLTGCGLVTVTRQGRSLFYAVDLHKTESLIGYLALDLGRARPDLMPKALHEKANPMPDTPFNVLFICSGNSARSIFAEALLRDLGAGKFTAHSAGTRPGTAINPFALEVLSRNGHDTGGLRAKHLSEFQGPAAPQMEFVFTVCDTAAAEDCPPWPGQPITGHWGLPDPVKATGTEAERALVFAQTYGALRRRIAAFVDLPFATLDRLALQTRVDAIGALPEKA